ncbi:MAG TPA: hypothetical protein VFD32_07030, partial [Dehalococcoidia bacterium]|nr:hypothetical protein [Dehalococcoidia bacterium]
MGRGDRFAGLWGCRHNLNLRAAIARSLTPLEKLGRRELLDGERRLMDALTAIHTPGHTPGHMSVLIVSDGQKALITG